MLFKDRLSEFSAAQIMAATGCPRGTAYDWKDGRREPPEWQQEHWLRLIEAETAKSAKKPGKKV